MKKPFIKSVSVMLTVLIFMSVCTFSLSAADEIGETSMQKSAGGVIIIPSVKPSGKVIQITYDCCEYCENENIFTYAENAKIETRYGGYCVDGNNAFVCWIDEKGNEYYCGDTLPSESVTLKAKKIPLLLGRDEILSFSNSDRYFHAEEFDGYYLSDEDYRMMRRNITRVFGLGSLPATGLSIALSTYPDWEWNGSCYGMSSLVLLQHYGVIDVLSEIGAENVSELTNSAELVSKINYYQWAAAGSFLCENFGLEKGSRIYKEQLENLYKSVSEGNIVMFTYYSGDIFVTSGHTVLITGAYTKNDGTKVLVAYDCNNPDDYLNGSFEQRFCIAPDYSSVTRFYNLRETAYLKIGAFNWTDDYGHFEPFNMDGKGRVLSWYSHFAKQLIRTAKIVLEAGIKIG